VPATCTGVSPTGLDSGSGNIADSTVLSVQNRTHIYERIVLEQSCLILRRRSVTDTQTGINWMAVEVKDRLSEPSLPDLSESGAS
jgi:hypothetical protein